MAISSIIATVTAFFILLKYEGHIERISGEKDEDRHAVEALRSERTRLLSLLDNLDEFIFVADPFTYEILYVNKSTKDRFKKDPIGGICYKELQGRDSPCENCTNDIILKERGKPYRWDCHNPVIDRDLMIVDRIIKWPDNRDVKFEIALDITERKQVEKALAKSKAILARAQSIAHVGNWAWDIKTNSMQWSEEIYRIFGCDTRESRPSYEWLISHVHPR